MGDFMNSTIITSSRPKPNECYCGEWRKEHTSHTKYEEIVCLGCGEYTKRYGCSYDGIIAAWNHKIKKQLRKKYLESTPKWRKHEQ